MKVGLRVGSRQEDLRVWSVESKELVVPEVERRYEIRG